MLVLKDSLQFILINNNLKRIFTNYINKFTQLTCIEGMLIVRLFAIDYKGGSKDGEI